MSATQLENFFELCLFTTSCTEIQLLIDWVNRSVYWTLLLQLHVQFEIGSDGINF